MGPENRQPVRRAGGKKGHAHLRPGLVFVGSRHEGSKNTLLQVCPQQQEHQLGLLVVGACRKGSTSGGMLGCATSTAASNGTSGAWWSLMGELGGPPVRSCAPALGARVCGVLPRCQHGCATPGVRQSQPW